MVSREEWKSKAQLLASAKLIIMQAEKKGKGLVRTKHKLSFKKKTKKRRKISERKEREGNVST